MDFETIKKMTPEEFTKWQQDNANKSFKAGLEKAKENLELNEKLKNYDEIKTNYDQMLKQKEYDLTYAKIQKVASDVGLKNVGLGKFVNEFQGDLKDLEGEKLTAKIKQLNDGDNKLYFEETEISPSKSFLDNDPITKKEMSKEERYQSSYFQGTTIRLPK